MQHEFFFSTIDKQLSQISSANDANLRQNRLKNIVMLKRNCFNYNNNLYIRR